MSLFFNTVVAQKNDSLENDSSLPDIRINGVPLDEYHENNNTEKGLITRMVNFMLQREDASIGVTDEMQTITIDGRVAFCGDIYKETPYGEKYTNGGVYQDTLLASILFYGYPFNKGQLQEKYGLDNQEAYRCTQLAVWRHTNPDAFDLGMLGSGERYELYLGYFNDLWERAINGDTGGEKVFNISNTEINLAIKGDYSESDIIKTSGSSGTFVFPSTDTVWSVDINGNKKSVFGIGESFKIRAVVGEQGTRTLTISGLLQDISVIIWRPENDETQHLFEGVLEDTQECNKNITITFPEVLPKDLIMEKISVKDSAGNIINEVTRDLETGEVKYKYPNLEQTLTLGNKYQIDITLYNNSEFNTTLTTTGYKPIHSIDVRYAIDGGNPTGWQNITRDGSVVANNRKVVSYTYTPNNASKSLLIESQINKAHEICFDNIEPENDSLSMQFKAKPPKDLVMEKLELYDGDKLIAQAKRNVDTGVITSQVNGTVVQGGNYKVKASIYNKSDSDTLLKWSVDGELEDAIVLSSAQTYDDKKNIQPNLDVNGTIYYVNKKLEPYTSAELEWVINVDENTKDGMKIWAKISNYHDNNNSKDNMVTTNDLLSIDTNIPKDDEEDIYKDLIMCALYVYDENNQIVNGVIRDINTGKITYDYNNGSRPLDNSSKYRAVVLVYNKSTKETTMVEVNENEKGTIIDYDIRYDNSAEEKWVSTINNYPIKANNAVTFQHEFQLGKNYENKATLYVKINESHKLDNFNENNDMLSIDFRALKNNDLIMTELAVYDQSNKLISKATRDIDTGKISYSNPGAKINKDTQYVVKTTVYNAFLNETSVIVNNQKNSLVDLTNSVQMYNNYWTGKGSTFEEITNNIKHKFYMMSRRTMQLNDSIKGGDTGVFIDNISYPKEFTGQVEVTGKINSAHYEYGDNENASNDSLTLNLDLIENNDLVLQTLKIYDDQATEDITDDILLYAMTRGAFNAIYEWPLTKPILPNNRTYRIETEVYNDYHKETTLDLSKVVIQLGFDEEATTEPSYDVKNYFNAIDKKIPAKGSATFNWTLYIPETVEEKISIGSAISNEHIYNCDDVVINNNWLVESFEIQKEDDSDLIAEDVVILDKDNNKVKNIKMGNDYAIQYRVKYEGPTRYKYVYKGVNTITNSPIYVKELKQYQVNLKGNIITSLPNTSNVGNVEKSLYLWGKMEDGSRNLNFIDDEYIYFTTDYYTFVEPYLITSAHINKVITLDYGIHVNANTDNDNFYFEQKDEYDLSVKNVRVSNSTEVPKDLEKLGVIVEYEIDYDVPKKYKEDSFIVSNTKIYIDGKVYDFEDPVHSNSENIFRRVIYTNDENPILPDFKKYDIEPIALNVKVVTNYNGANYEYKNGVNNIYDNNAGITSNKNNLNIEKTDFNKVGKKNYVNRSVKTKKFNNLNPTMVKSINGMEFPFYTYTKDSITTTNKEYYEKYSIESVKFRSKYTQENYEELGIKSDGWVELNNSTAGIIQAGYGFELKIVTSYKNNLVNDKYIGEDNTNTDFAKPNIPNDILVEYKNMKVDDLTGEVKEEDINDSRYTALGINKSKICFDSKILVNNDNEIKQEFTSINKIYIDELSKDKETSLKIITPIINGVNYYGDSTKLGDTNTYKINIKGSYTDDIDSLLNF